MGIPGSALVAAFLALACVLPAASAQELPHPLHPDSQRSCLNQKERRALIETGAVLQLAAAVGNVRNRIPGTLVRARLCHRGEGYVYVLTVLAHDGKVTRVVVDAVKGTLVGER